MSRVALVAVFLGASVAQAQQAPLAQPQPPPAWMPAPPPRLGRGEEEQARALRREAFIFAGIGIGLVAGGVAVDVVALDFPQSQATTRDNGNLVTKRVLGDANWAELAAGTALLATGFVLVCVGLYKRHMARKLDESAR
jgi:hypothetical protein